MKRKLQFMVCQFCAGEGDTLVAIPGLGRLCIECVTERFALCCTKCERHNLPLVDMPSKQHPQLCEEHANEWYSDD